MNNFDSKISNHRLTASVAAKSQQGEKTGWWERWKFTLTLTVFPDHDHAVNCSACYCYRTSVDNECCTVSPKSLSRCALVYWSKRLPTALVWSRRHSWRHALRAQVKSTIGYLLCIHFAKRPRYQVVLLLNVNFPVTVYSGELSGVRRKRWW